VGFQQFESLVANWGESITLYFSKLAHTDKEGRRNVLLTYLQFFFEKKFHPTFLHL
jgi:hypothetical protein